MELLKIANAAYSDFVEKTADAMARAFQRGEIDLSTDAKRRAFSSKLQGMDARQSGNMGAMGVHPFANGAEGDVSLGAMRGKGLGIRKTFVPHDEESVLNTVFFNHAKTRTVQARAEHMAAHPDIYPEIYGHRAGANPMHGSIDMEYVHGNDLINESGIKQHQVMSDLKGKLAEKGFGEQRGLGNPAFYSKKEDLVIGDVHGGNVRYDPVTGKGKIIDPMVYRGNDPAVRHGGLNISGKASAKEAPPLNYGTPGDNPNFGKANYKARKASGVGGLRGEPGTINRLGGLNIPNNKAFKYLTPKNMYRAKMGIGAAALAGLGYSAYQSYKEDKANA